MGNRKDIVNFARSYIGINESNSRYRAMIDEYNRLRVPGSYKMHYGEAWCATFVSYCAIKTGNRDLVPLHTYCPSMINIAKSMGIWQEYDGYTPQPGDIIMYDWQDSGYGDNTGWADHVGIVESVNGATICVIEGNKHRAVGRRWVLRGQRYIRGYITPRYDAEPSRQENLTPALDKGTSKYRVLEDGWLGYESIVGLQIALGLDDRDGVISRQWPGSKPRHYAITKITYDFAKPGSYVIMAMQKLAGCRDVDGWAGRDFICDWQQFLRNEGYNIAVDGSFGNDTALATQKWTNSRLRRMGK